MRIFNCQLLIVGMVCLLVGCQPKKPEAKSSGAPTETPEIEASTFLVESRVWPTVAKVQGSLYALETTTIAAKVAGRVVEVNCDLGDQVSADEQLIKIDPREYELMVAQAQAQLVQARAAVGLKEGDLIESLNPLNAPPVRETRALFDEAQQQVRRLKSLFGQGAVVATDLESAQAAESVAEARYNSSLNSVREKIALIRVQSANLDLANQQLTDCVILAPLQGTVQNRSISVGSYVNVGQPMLQLVRTNVLRYRAAVPERFAQKLAIGQKVKIHVHNHPTLEVAITRISPTLDPVSRSLVFEADVPNEAGTLRSGLFAQADIELDPNSTAVAIPLAALVRFAGVEKVWKVTDGKLKEELVTLGREENDQIEIIAGVKVGDTLLSDGRMGRAGKLKSPSENNLANQSGAKADTAADSKNSAAAVDKSNAGSDAGSGEVREKGTSAADSKQQAQTAL